MESALSLLQVIAEMTPFLLFGFLCAGILHVLVPKNFYRNYLADNSFKSVLLAALFGIPLPLCSCGVLPTAMSLRKEGASKGATTSFMTATPQTGVDSILATYSVFGLPFAVIRPLAALITSVFSGFFVTVFDNDSSKNESVCSDEKNKTENTGFGVKIKEILHYAYVAMLQDIGPRMLLGLFVAGLIAVFLPDNFLLSFSDKPLLEMLAVIIVALPMYVCATGSIPIAAALMLKGLTPGAALVFLMAGPAVSLASLMIVQKVLGLRTMIIYVFSIVIGAITFGLLIDYMAPMEWFTDIEMAKQCCHVQIPLWKQISTILFFALIFNALLLKYKPKQNKVMENSITYKVGGMSCNHCKMTVETNLMKLEGVTSVSADIATGNVVIEGTSDENSVKNVVESLGFTYVERL
ncbi:MAG: permease [Bacteroidales bacterium]|nr:permease [Bacteroidales bacterium]